MQRGDHWKALGFFDKAVEFADRNAEFHFNRASALLKLGRIAEAQRAYEKAKALDISYKGKLNVLEK